MKSPDDVAMPKLAKCKVVFVDRISMINSTWNGESRRAKYRDGYGRLRSGSTRVKELDCKDRQVGMEDRHTSDDKAESD